MSACLLTAETMPKYHSSLPKPPRKRLPLEAYRRAVELRRMCKLTIEEAAGAVGHKRNWLVTMHRNLKQQGLAIGPL